LLLKMNNKNRKEKKAKMCFRGLLQIVSILIFNYLTPLKTPTNRESTFTRATKLEETSIGA
jgi:hypothetical protein